ncbi:MAG: hypothetical protein M3536_05070, partial [Actinomycetota bacterium]|nr:hypothetical protein [Actinomycetota bacterium]
GAVECCGRSERAAADCQQAETGEQQERCGEDQAYGRRGARKGQRAAARLDAGDLAATATATATATAPGAVDTDIDTAARLRRLDEVRAAAALSDAERNARDSRPWRQKDVVAYK